jgi:hypothetical protein
VRIKEVRVRHCRYSPPPLILPIMPPPLCHFDFRLRLISRIATDFLLHAYILRH